MSNPNNDILLSLLNNKNNNPTIDPKSITDDTIKWQTDDRIHTFEPISQCNWIEKANDVIIANLSFVRFTNLNQTLILNDPIKKIYVVINKTGYLQGKNLSSVNFVSNGRWISSIPVEIYFDKTKTCQPISTIGKNDNYFKFFHYFIILFIVKETIKYPNGDEYKGEIKNGKKHGKGEMIYQNGTKYNGDWLDDQFSGSGRKHNLKYIN